MSAIDPEVCKQKVEEGADVDAQREREHSTLGEDLDMAGFDFSCGAIGYGLSWSTNRTPKIGWRSREVRVYSPHDPFIALGHYDGGVVHPRWDWPFILVAAQDANFAELLLQGISGDGKARVR